MSKADTITIANSLGHLLFLHEKVCIPDLGTFITTHKEAYIHPVTHSFRPANKELRFNPSELSNDGLLTDLISERKGISLREAGELIKAFSERMKSSLKDDANEMLPGIGVFRMNNRGEILFDQDQSQNFLASSFGLEEFNSPPILRTAASTPPPPETPVAPQFPKREEEKVELKEEKDPEEPVAAIEEVMEEKKTSKKKSPLAILWFIIPLIGLAFIIWFWWPQWEFTWNRLMNTEAVTVEPLEELPEEVLPEEMIPDTSASSAELAPDTSTAPIIIPEEDITSTESTPEKKKYYIIAGCFKSETNALRLRDGLISKGYTASIEGKTPKGLHRVCYQGFNDFGEANVALKKILKEENSGAWLFKLEND